MVWGIERCPGRHPLGEWERAARGANVENSVKALLIHCILTFLACVQAFGHSPKMGPTPAGLRNEVPASTVVFTLWVRSPQIFLGQSQGDSHKGALGSHGGTRGWKSLLHRLCSLLIQSFESYNIWGRGSRKISTQETIYLMETCEYVAWARLESMVTKCYRILFLEVVSPEIESYESDYIVWDLLYWYQSRSLTFQSIEIGHRPDKKLKQGFIGAPLKGLWRRRKQVTGSLACSLKAWPSVPSMG